MMDGYLTPGEMADLNSRKAAMIREEFTSTDSRCHACFLVLPAHASGCPEVATYRWTHPDWDDDTDGTYSPLDYDGREDDSTTYGGERD